MRSSTSLFLSAAAALLGASALAGAAAPKPLQVQLSKRDAQWPSPIGLVASVPARQEAAKRALGGAWRGWRGWHYPKPGHSVRQGQRMARKRRSVAAHRRACRVPTRCGA